jgi:asparagine synthase (glutamine-hydrolysing)
MAAGLRLGSSLLGSPRMAKYAPLMNAPFPGYYYSRTSNPYFSGVSQLGRLYSDDFSHSIDRERSLEPVHRLQTSVEGRNTLDAMLYIDTKTWLPDDLLIKADKMTMANSLELRVPLLDHRVLEFAASLPPRFKLRGFRTKYIFKKALEQRIPKPIRDRKKAGFPVPYGRWIQEELKDAFWALLTDSRTVNRGYFNKRAVENLLQEAGSGSEARSKEIFSLATLELWRRVFLEGGTPPSLPAPSPVREGVLQ